MRPVTAPCAPIYTVAPLAEAAARADVMANQ